MITFFRIFPWLWLTAVFCLTGVRVFPADGDLTWPQWRGPTRDGKVPGENLWPDSLAGEHLTRTWRIELSEGYSSPIVTPRHVIVLETRNKTHEVVRALNPLTGEESWRREWEGGMDVAEFGVRTGSWIKSTPTFDAGRLYISGMRDVLICLDEATGAEIWRVDFSRRYGTPIPELGFICSPLVSGDSVYVQTADSTVCLNKWTGESRWRSLIEEEKGHGSYSSPDIHPVLGKPQLLVAMISDIAGLDPDTGDVLWLKRLDSIEQGCILTPIVYSDQIFTSTRKSRSGMFGLSKAGGQFGVTEVWKNKATVYMSPPIVLNKYVYLHLKSSRMACLNLETGEEQWTSTKSMGFYCSMISHGDRILALSNEGELLLFRARPDRFDPIDSRKISESETWGHLAITGSRLFIRELNAITAYQWK